MTESLFDAERRIEMCPKLRFHCPELDNRYYHPNITYLNKFCFIRELSFSCTLATLLQDTHW
jgi:hypothetical protein